MGKKYDTVLDLESSGYKWIYPKELENMNKEVRKTTRFRKLNDDWPNNYIAEIKAMRNKYKIILIAPDEDIRECLDNAKIKYLICVPDKKCKDEYYNRFLKRGNTKEFINIRISVFEKRIDELMRQTSDNNIIVLKQGEYLEDYLKHNNLI